MVPTSTLRASRPLTPPVRRRPVDRARLRRRRATVVVFLVAFVLALFVGAGQVLANRGGAPASTPAVRPASTHVVQPGDTLWALAEEFHGNASVSGYLQRLVDANGGAALEVGQVVVLP